MKRALLLLGLAGCATTGVAEDYTWTIQTPSAVGRGAVFAFTVRATRVSGKVVNGLEYRYEILRPGGESTSGTGSTGAPQKAQAPLTPGRAVLRVIGTDRKGKDLQVQEAPFEVK
jgi:hypothetical protein